MLDKLWNIGMKLFPFCSTTPNSFPGADPGFLRVGAPTPWRERQPLYIVNIFYKISTKLKKMYFGQIINL